MYRKTREKSAGSGRSKNTFTKHTFKKDVFLPGLTLSRCFAS